MNSDQKTRECSICLENITPNEEGRTKCSHVFHINCIKGWLKHKSDCPLCRTRISNVLTRKNKQIQKAPSNYLPTFSFLQDQLSEETTMLRTIFAEIAETERENNMQRRREIEERRAEAEQKRRGHEVIRRKLNRIFRPNIMSCEISNTIDDRAFLSLLEFHNINNK